MNIEEYISSGVLELYAAGALTAAEQAEVELLAQKYPEVKAELNQITQAYDQYASLHAVTPPTQLKAKVLGAISKQASNGLAHTPPPINNAEAPARVITMSPARQAADNTRFKWLIAASVSLLILSNALSIYFYQKWKDSDNNLQLALATQQQYANQVQRVQKQLNQQEVALALVSDPSTQRVELKGVPKSPAPNSQVTVFWHKSTSKVLLSVNNLPTPPDNQQYQLWAIANGKPVDAGLIAGNQPVQVFQQMKAVNQAQAFAITLEPKGGSVNPTMDQMYVMGAI